MKQEYLGSFDFTNLPVLEQLAAARQEGNYALEYNRLRLVCNNLKALVRELKNNVITKAYPITWEDLPVEKEQLPENEISKLLATGWNKYAQDLPVFQDREQEQNYFLPREAGNNLEKWLTQTLISPYLPSDAKEALEIGPGNGKLSNILRKRTKILHLADFSKALLEEVYNNCEQAQNIRFHLLNNLNLPVFMPESLDFVFSFNLFIYFEPRQIYWYLRQLHPLLKSGGVGIIHYSNVLSEPGWQQFKRELETEILFAGAFNTMGVMSPALMEIFLNDLGFQVIASDTKILNRDAVCVFQKRG